MTANSSPVLQVCVVIHTHWDREWYHPAGRFRQRLVGLLDELLDEPERPGAPFLLDGQSVLLDDYLAVRPERRAALSEALQSGALDAGPWYVLADELIPSGESLVRNLFAGRCVLRALGAAPPQVLYSPDAFGHPAMLPAIAAGFGFPVIILWRGYGGSAWPPGDTVRWRGPDGSVVLLYHLPPDGYEFGSSLPPDDASASARWDRMKAVLAPRATLGVTLLPSGADHHARQRHLGRAMDALARAAAPARVRRCSLATFAAELSRRADDVPLPEVQGELRNSYGYAWTLQGTFAVRAAQKRRHASIERLLLRDMEPWAALHWVRTRRDQRPLVRAAWRALLLCQPHDTLCGCSTDDVARAMDARLDDAQAQARGVRDDALLCLAGIDPDAMPARGAEWRPVVFVRNRAAQPRGGVAELEVLRVVRPEPVGPGSAGFHATDAPDTPFALCNGSVPFQQLDAVRRHDRVESPRHYPVNDVVQAHRVMAWIDSVPGYGATAITIDTAATSPPPAVPAVRAGASWMENDSLRVEILANGAVRVDARAYGFSLPSLLRLEDVGDVGDLYTHSTRLPTIGPDTFLGAHPVHTGPLRAELHASWRFHLPVRGDRNARSANRLPLIVHAAFTLDAGAPFLRVRAWGTNSCRDHRLRIVFATALAEASVFADAAFATLQRAPIHAQPDAAEAPPPTAPLARYVTLATRERGATIYSDGLAEYEVSPAGDVAITLLRAVGELSRPELPERPGHAGWPIATPQAQSRGRFEGDFAILPHGPRDKATAMLAERVADDVLLPLAGGTLRSAVELPADVTGVSLEGDGLSCSAIKQAEQGDDLVLRCVNRTDGEVEGQWRCGFPISLARRARLDETPVDVLPADGGRIRFRAQPGEIVTVLVR